MWMAGEERTPTGVGRGATGTKMRGACKGETWEVKGPEPSAGWPLGAAGGESVGWDGF